MIHQIIPNQPIVVSPPTGASQLPLVEIDKAKVRTKHQSVLLPKAERAQAESSYGNFGDVLDFTAWEMCHAAKKTELTRTFTSHRANGLGLLFSHEHHDRFLWDTQNLRCADGSAMWLEDFSGTGLAGRIGEALSYLTMTKRWGYVYWDRIASVYLRAARDAQINHHEMIRVARYTGQLTGKKVALQPDFVFEKNDRTVALMEAKGSFIAPGNTRPDVKGILKHGLEQLDAWGSLIAPAPASSIAIGSFLREASDPDSDPSLILHVDPPAKHLPDVEPIDLPRDEIRRGNYGVWLAEMGFRNSGRSLLNRREIETSPVELPTVTLNGRDYALSIQGWRVDQRRFATLPWWSFEMMHGPWRHRFEFLRDVGITGVYATGLEVSTLRAICTALADPTSQGLMDLSPTAFEREDAHPDGFYGSTMPDGSLLGILSNRYFSRDMRLETFNL